MGRWWFLLLALGACDPATAAPLDGGSRDAGRDAALDGGGIPEADAGAAPPTDPFACGPPLGARRHADGSVEVRVHAPNATRVEVALFGAALGEPERLRVPMEARDGRFEGRFDVRVDARELTAAGLSEPLFYGLRVFGPNWPFDPAWTPGSEAGRLADVDADGHRMNPNKLVLDPYALEVSHDPIHADHRDYGVYRTDADHRAIDSGPFAPKGLVIACAAATPGPERPLRDDVVYEVHLRGFTRADPTVPVAERGTYAGAARRAAYLRELGVTAIELLPLHETPNDQNELTDDASGDNYWGYSTLSFFAPDRRYAADRGPGGPTRELRAMVEAFHAEGIKVFVDVVYNHTAEGGARGGEAAILSWRGLDSATFYELTDDRQGYVSSNGVGPNLNTADPVTADLVIDSLRYYRDVLGVDGFRFDLASVVANGCTRGCYRYDAALPERIAAELGRDADGGPGADLIAEAWGTAAGTYQVGHFPRGWSEWNDRYRDAVRRDLNRLGVQALPLRELMRRLSGSPDLYEDDGRPPAASINFVVAHDGMTLNDLFRYGAKQNDLPWPYGPSPGGTNDDLAYDHRGDPVRQATATRTAMALLAVSAGVPMITGGDESGRTLRANNNPYNLDNEASWIAWPGDEPLREATARLFAFRAAHAALRPARHWRVFTDADGDGLTEVRWFRDDGRFVDDAYIDAEANHFVAWQLDGDELGDAAASLFFAYNGWSGTLTVAVPDPPPGLAWHRAIDTGPNGEAFGFVDPSAAAPIEGPLEVTQRTLVGLVAR
ncbi:MAG: glycogen-debranching protein [Myxococcales bacterium]|nr:glycogen-debranching protein [Myxococcales bacterium]